MRSIRDVRRNPDNSFYFHDFEMFHENSGIDLIHHHPPSVMCSPRSGGAFGAPPARDAVLARPLLCALLPWLLGLAGRLGRGRQGGLQDVGQVAERARLRGALDLCAM